MTMASRSPGYWPSPWPGEDGGPQRLAAARGAAPPSGALAARSRSLLGATMCVLRDPGEVYVLACSLGGPDTTSRVERIDPVTLDPIATSPELAGGPFWPGGLACHANGSLYVTYGRWCHRLAPDCSVLASVQLPRDRPYNSLVILPDGTLVMKDIGSRTEPPGSMLHLPDDVAGSELVWLEPDGLTIVDRHELAEGSVARLSIDERGRVVAVGDTRVWWIDRAIAGTGIETDIETGTGTGIETGIEVTSSAPYATIPGQSYGWDPVTAGRDVWFLDNGAGSEAMAGRGTFVGLHTDDPAAPPLHLVRVRGGQDERIDLVPVYGSPGGIIANPPLVDVDRAIAVGYDSGHAVMTAWRVGAGEADEDDHPGALEELWSRAQGHGSHLVLWPDEGVLATADFDPSTGTEHCVLLDITSGDEVGRVATGSPIQSVVFPCPGWDRDLYTVTFTTLSRISGTA